MGVGVVVVTRVLLYTVFSYQVSFRQVSNSSRIVRSCRQHRRKSECGERRRQQKQLIERGEKQGNRARGNSTWRLLLATQVSINMHNSGPQNRVASAKLLRQFAHTKGGRNRKKRNY